MKYQQVRKTTGSWIDKSTIKTGVGCKLVSETTKQPSSFKDKEGNDKTQDVCKAKFDGQDEAVNVNLNGATIGALISAFGEDSIDWQNKPLTAELEKMRVGGKAVVALYFIPEGYEKVDDDNGYAVIQMIEEAMPVIQEGNPLKSMDAPADDIDVKDIPF